MKSLLIGLGSFVMLSLALSSCGGEKKASIADGGAVKVQTMVAGHSDLTSSRVYSGTVEESSGAAVSFPVAGTIKTVNVGAGDRVAKGQLIASLDRTTLQNAYNIAKATLDEAQDAYSRMKQLHDANSLADMKWVEIQNTLKQAQSGEAIARKALDDGNLYAPFSGYVSEKFLDAGMTAAPAVPVVKLVTINPVKVSVSVPEGEIANISQGQKAEITVKAAGKTYEGTLVEKGVSANPLTRAYDVKFSVNNPDGILLPGMICDLTFENSEPRSVIVVPTSAVLLDASNQNFVWLADKGRAAKRVVTVDGFADDGLIVSSGIESGDTVIVAGQQKVSNGTPLKFDNK